MSSAADDEELYGAKGAAENIVEDSGENFIGELLVDNYPVPSRTTPGVDLSFSCRNLIKMDWLSKSDPLVAVFAYTTDGKWEFINKTEIMKNNDSPKFKNKVYVPVNKDYTLATKIRFNVYDVDQEKTLFDKDIIGFYDTTVADLVRMGDFKSGKDFKLSSENTKKLRKLGKKNTSINIAVDYCQEEKKFKASASDDNPFASYGEYNAKTHEFKKRVVRNESVPFLRRVKVPVVTRKVVPTTFQKRIKIKKYVEINSFEEYQEEYTVFEEVKATRTVEKWVEKTVMEDFTRKVPVTKTRMVKKPVTRIDTVEDFQMVTIPGTKIVEVEGFRIDEVEDRKLIEVEEWEVYELLPHNTGQIEEGKITELGWVGLDVDADGNGIPDWQEHGKISGGQIIRSGETVPVDYNTWSSSGGDKKAAASEPALNASAPTFTSATTSTTTTTTTTAQPQATTSASTKKKRKRSRKKKKAAVTEEF